MAIDINEALNRLVGLGGSDLHLKVPAPPMARVDGQLLALEGMDKLLPEDTESALRTILDDEDKLKEFNDEGEVDFAYALPGIARYRVNAFRQRGSVSMVCRAIPFSVKTIDELMLPPVIRELAE